MNQEERDELVYACETILWMLETESVYPKVRTLLGIADDVTDEDMEEIYHQTY